MSKHPARALILLVPLSAFALWGCSQDRPDYASVGGGVETPYNGANGGVAVGKCVTGATRTCTKKLSEHEGVLSCFCGTQECVDELWGECGGAGSVTTKTAPESETQSGPGQSTAALSQPSKSAPGCASDPCNPYCVGFDEKPPTPITPPFAEGNSFEGNPDPWGNAPEGFEGKQDCSEGGDCRTGYPKKCGGDPLHYNRFDGCLADHHCNQSTGKCDRNGAGWKWPTSVCAGVDLTAGPSCNNGKNDGFPLCNRGNTAVPAGTTIESTIKTGNWLDLDSCPLNPSGTECSIKLTAPLNPGQCVRIVDGTHCNWSGNAVVYVNSNQAIKECGMPQPSPPIGVSAPGCSNNWSDVKNGSVCTTFSTGGYATKVVTETYNATCPSGYHPQWDRLTYSATTPSDSKLTFAVQMASAKTPTAFSPTTPKVAATAPTTHPASCGSGGPSPCPVDLYTVIGDPAAVHHPNLKLTVTLTPSTDAQSAPSVSSWQITYSCVPKE